MERASTKPDRGTQAIEGDRSESQLKRIPVCMEQIQVLGHVVGEGCGSLEEGVNLWFS